MGKVKQALYISSVGIGCHTFAVKLMSLSLIVLRRLIKDVLPNINRTQAAEGTENAFLSLVTLTFDTDFQTRSSEGPNTSSVWIWRKSVQQFPRYFIHKQKATNGAKNRTLPSLLRAGLILLLCSPKRRTVCDDTSCNLAVTLCAFRFCRIPPQ